MMRNREVFVRALRAAAATTGVLKRSATFGLAAGALAAGTLVLAGCGGSKGATPQPPSGSGGDEADAAAMSSASDAGVAATPDCEGDPGFSSECCKAAQAAGDMPAACTPWGPPAPPAYAGERLA